MGYSVITFEGDGVTTTFPVAFTMGYLSTDDVKCRVGNEVDEYDEPVYRALTWNPGNPGLVTIGGAVPGVGESIVLSREVDKENLLYDFQKGEAIDEVSLDESHKQLMMAVHEMLDGVGLKAVAVDIDMQGHKLLNLYVDENDDTSVATVGFIKELTVGDVADAIAAAAAATQAAIDAENARDEAEAHAEGPHNNLTSRDVPDAHPIAAITGLQDALSGKSATGHTHTVAEITNAGTAATRDVGTAPGNVPVLDAEGKLAESVLPAGSNVVGVALIIPGGGGGTWVYVDEDGNTVPSPGADYFSTHPVWGIMHDVVIDGQYMVKIPKFYIRRATIGSGENAGKEAWWISDQPVDGYVVHPAFKVGGSEVDQIYVGKYQASMDDSKLGSKPGVLPAADRSLTQFQADAAARNVSGVSGFGLWSVYHWSAIQWLYLVENATMDSQSETGQGRVSASSAANVDASDVAQATYRGIVGLWGNVWQWMDGLKTISGVINLWDREGNQTWVNTGQTPPNMNSWTYPVTFMDANGSGYDMDDVFLSKTGPTSNSGATAPDGQYWSNSAEYFPLVGGNWSHGASAGLWDVNCTAAASNSNAGIGARLAKV